MISSILGMETEMNNISECCFVSYKAQMEKLPL